MPPNPPRLATTEAGAALMAWAQSDVRPIQDFGFDSVEDAVVLIEAEARRVVVPATFPLDLETFLAGLDSPNHSPESRRAWVALFYRDLQRAVGSQGVD